MNTKSFPWNVLLVHDDFVVTTTPLAVSEADAQKQAEQTLIRDNGLPSWVVADAQQVVTDRA